MRIAQISPVEAPVRHEGADSVGQFVWLLSRELTRLGHDVTVFGARGSQVEGKFVETLPAPYGSGALGTLVDWRLCEQINISRAIERSGEFDVLHSHAYLWGMAMENLARAPMIHTLHVTPYHDLAPLLGLLPNARVTGISRFQWSLVPALKPFAVIHHGAIVSQFTFRDRPDGYVCYLGRFVAEKGALTAIRAARDLGLELVLAGPRGPYFKDFIEPHVDGTMIRYAGPVNATQRDRLLGGARALLYPITEPEPFGLVQIEAMLCGTPVVATRIGAVPEIIDEGVTGFSAESYERFVDAIPRAFELDRRRVRETAVRRFSSERMAREYVEVYERVVGEAGKKS
jgi:glycosyltransferase involved in cell wall biosynthesis